MNNNNNNNDHDNMNNMNNMNNNMNNNGLNRKVIVLKVGSSTISGVDNFIKLPMISSLIENICNMRRNGYKIIIVSSGAVSVGCQRLRLNSRPKDLITKQAVAAVGQSRLMRIYDDLFAHYDQPIAQILLSRENINQAHHYKNAQNTINRLLSLNIIPIVNENDTVAVEELQFGDNDNLSALVASLVHANWLFLLTDVNGLYTDDPLRDPNAKRIEEINPENLDDLKSLAKIEKPSGSWGTGGMVTKIQAARISVASGVNTCIIHAEKHQYINDIMSGKRGNGTVFIASSNPLSENKRWIAHGSRLANGSVLLDDGAIIAILGKASLFAAGIVQVNGKFLKGDTIGLYDKYNNEIGRGISNYSSEDLNRIKGKSSKDYKKVLNKYNENLSEAVVDRSNLALTQIL